MIELHLIGYTEDGDHLVFDLDAEGEGRYLVPVDPDLLATLEATRRERIAQGKPVDARESEPRPVPETRPAGGDPEAPRRSDPLPPSRPAVPVNGRAATSGGTPPAGGPPAAARGTDPLPPASEGRGEAPDPGEVADAPDPAADAEATPPTGTVSRSGLSPAEIQARLRAGRSVRAVAREADADPDWVERWHVPIVAERERVLADARSRRLDRPRARPLGSAVDRSLSDRGVPPDEAVWRVVRRDDGRWKVSVRFEEDGRPRTATWLLDPDAERLRAQSPLATELAAPGQRSPRR